MAGTTVRDEEIGLETTIRGPQWHTISADMTAFLDTGDKMFNSVEAMDLGAGCFVRFPHRFMPKKSDEFNRPTTDYGDKIWVPDVHLEKTDDGWMLAPGATR